MIRVTVSIRNELTQPDYDVQIPAEVPIVELTPLLAEAVGWRTDDSGRLLSHSIFAEPQGGLLDIDASLAELQVWDGNSLIFEAFTSAYFLAASGRTYPLQRSKVLVSRVGSVDGMTVPNSIINLGEEEYGQTVSSRHATLLCRKGQWQLRHHSQTNGTYLNNQLLDQEDVLALQDGDIVEFGGVILTFRLGEVSAP